VRRKQYLARRFLVMLLIGAYGVPYFVLRQHVFFYIFAAPTANFSAHYKLFSSFYVLSSRWSFL
jgi:hypothetical protein